MKINNKSLLMTFVVFCLISCGGKEKSANQTKKLMIQDSESPLVFEPGNYTADSDSSSVLWECGWIGGSTHNGYVYLKEGLVNIKNS